MLEGGGGGGGGTRGGCTFTECYSQPYDWLVKDRVRSFEETTLFVIKGAENFGGLNVYIAKKRQMISNSKDIAAK